MEQQVRPKVDYDEIAPCYDAHRRGGGPYLETLVTLARSCHAQRVLEIGPGTGNNTAAFLDAYPCRLCGLDLSQGMLVQAKAKRLPVCWIRGSAARIPVETATMDFIFGCYVLHHLPDLREVFMECARVLAKGCAAFVTAPIHFIEQHPMNYYFPSFAKIDAARFQRVEIVLAAFKDAGFTRTDAQHVKAAPVPIDRHYVERVAQKFVSTYLLIPQDEFTEGLRRLREDVQAKGRLDKPIVWESVTVWGWK